MVGRFRNTEFSSELSTAVIKIFNNYDSIKILSVKGNDIRKCTMI